MLFQVDSKRASYWPIAAKIGLLVMAALVLARVPVPVARTQAIRAAASAQALQRDLGQPTLFAPIELAYYQALTPAQARLQRSWRTIDGSQVVEAKVFRKPSVDLPRSPYGDATWDPLTDIISFEPFVKPTLAYFTGSLIAATTKTNFQTALSTATDTDIIEIQASMTWNRTGGTTPRAQANFPARGDTGHVLLRDQDTFSGMPAQGVRVTASTFAASNTQLIDATDSLWDFTNATRGWYFYGLHFRNVHTGTGDNARMLNIAATNSSNGSTNSVANVPKYIVVEGCWFENQWDPTFTYETRCGLNPGIQYGYITENMMSGITSNGAECKGINSSQCYGIVSVTNNFLEATTENIMWGGAAFVGDGTEAAPDIYFARNYLYRRPEWMTVGAGFVYTNHKNFYENKQGVRQVCERNECVGHSGQGQNHDLQIKHACQTSADVGKVQCNNNLYRHNRFFNSACPWSIATTTSTLYTANGTHRIEIANNLWWGQHSNVGASINRPLLSDLSSPNKKIADIFVHNNTWTAPRVCLTVGGGISTNTDGAPNFRMINNVDYAPTHAFNGPLANAGLAGAALLNNIAGPGGWQFAGNTAIGTGTQVWSGIPGNYVVPAAQLQFVNAAAGDYTLVDYSAYTGTDGNAPGVDYAHLSTMLTGVVSGAAA